MIKLLGKRYIRNARRKRALTFKKNVVLKDTFKILDLGGGNGNYINSLIPTPNNYEIYIADIDKPGLKSAEIKYGYKTIELNETGKLPFEDKYFDVVFCNSVIEHVTVPKRDIYKITNKEEFQEKALKRQQSFADEIRRVSKQYFVQTPNRYFILEAHTWFINVFVFLSRENSIRLIKLLNKFWPKKTDPDWNLLTKGQMGMFFPEARILPEKSLGFVKSWMAVKSI